MKLVGLTIYCNNAEKSRDFYVNHLNFHLVKEWEPMKACVVIVLEKDGMTIELLERVGAPLVVHNDFTTTLEFEVKEIEKYFEELKTKNIKIKSNLRNIGPNTKLFEIFDPDNYPICFISNA